MKLLIQLPKKSPLEIEVEPKSTIEDAKEKLISQHKLPQGRYNFILHGRILKNPEPFSSLKEKTRLILYIKKETKPRPDPEALEAEEAQQQQQQQQQQRGNQSQRNNQQAQLDQLVQALRSGCETVFMEHLYNNDYNFWNHPQELSEICDIIQTNAGSLIFSNFLLNHFSHIFRYINISPQLIFDLIGIRNPPRIYNPNENRAIIETFSNAQRQAFNRLKTICPDETKLIEAFQKNDCDEEKTRNYLQNNVK